MRAPPATLYALGYDDMGNCPRLLTESDRRAIDAGAYLRVGGEALCPECGQPYRVHPEVQGALWLRRACAPRGDKLVKL